MSPSSSSKKEYHVQSHLFRELETDSRYEVIVQTRNKFGWSRPTKSFIFSTRDKGKDIKQNQKITITKIFFPSFLPSEVEAAVVFPEDEDSEAEELLAVLRLTIQNKRTAFNKTKNVTATATPTTTSSEVMGQDVEAKVNLVYFAI